MCSDFKSIGFVTRNLLNRFQNEVRIRELNNDGEVNESADRSGETNRTNEEKANAEQKREYINRRLADFALFEKRASNKKRPA